jgi:hypothetical protein
MKNGIGFLNIHLSMHPISNFDFKMNFIRANMSYVTNENYTITVVNALI